MHWQLSERGGRHVFGTSDFRFSGRVTALSLRRFFAAWITLATLAAAVSHRQMNICNLVVLAHLCIILQPITASPRIRAANDGY